MGDGNGGGSNTGLAARAADADEAAPSAKWRESGVSVCQLPYANTRTPPFNEIGSADGRDTVGANGSDGEATASDQTNTRVDKSQEKRRKTL